MEEKKVRYRCILCGAEFDEPNPDGSCPVCGAPADMLEKIDENGNKID